MNGGQGSRRLLLVVVTVAVALAVADSSVVVLALPDLYNTFDVSIVGVSWTITAYNLAIVVGALAVLPLEQRVPGHVIAGVGFAVFALASLVCGFATTFEVLIVGRVVQGIGAALALTGAIPVLAGIGGDDERARHLWGTAATLGAAAGPALGGFLTQLFSWRSIFLIQAPLAAIAIAAVFDRRARAVERAPRPESGPPARTWLANLGFLLLFAALVGALFLAVLLLVIVWGLTPIQGAIVVSALPVAAVLVRRLAPLLGANLAATAGGVALAGGLVALGILPAARAAWAAPGLAACGVGLGLLSAVLGPAAVPPTEPGVRAATLSTAARHAGFVLGLAVIAPVLSTSLNEGARDATRATTAEILDAPIGLRTKVSLALDMRDRVADAPRGEVPDVSAPFDERGAADDENMREARDGVVGAIRDTITRGFRSAFLIAALFGALAALVAALLPGGAVARGRDALAVAMAVIVLVPVFIVGEIAAGARAYGERTYVDPCNAPADPFPEGEGIDGTLQRIALSAISGAACELGTSREELILSLEPKSGFGPEVTWTRESLEDALRAGLAGAIEDADDRNTIPGIVAIGLEGIVERAPIDWLLGRIDIPFLED